MSYSATFVKSGNIKIGNMYAFNKLAGGGKIAGCKGTCTGNCDGCYNKKNPKKSACYVFKSYVQYGWDKSTVVKSHIKNTKAIRNDINQAFKDLDLQLKRAKKKPSTIRIHSAGELEKKEELIQWITLAKKYEKIKFYLYTKAYAIVDEVLNDMELPKNFFINISVWHDRGVDVYKKYIDNSQVRAFVYDDGYDYNLKIDCYCPAYDKDGKLHHDITCDKCGICFGSKARVCACYSH